VEVHISEIGIDRIRKAEFFAGFALSDGSQAFFAPLDQKGGKIQRWMVLHDQPGLLQDDYIIVYTTEEMKLLYRSTRNGDNEPKKAPDDMWYRFLVRCGALRMKLRDGCPGCRVFWHDRGAEGQCDRCHRCYGCCSKEKVPFSCASGAGKQEKQKQRYFKSKRR